MVDARDVAAVAASIAASPVHAGKTYWLTGPGTEMNAQAASLTADGDAAWVSDDVASLLNRPVRAFGEIAADHAHVFS